MNQCADCQAALVSTDWGELCGACALSSGLAHERDLVGDYERYQLLGEGAMGSVYLARHIHEASGRAGRFVPDDVRHPAFPVEQLLLHPSGLPAGHPAGEVTARAGLFRKIAGHTPQA